MPSARRRGPSVARLERLESGMDLIIFKKYDLVYFFLVYPTENLLPLSHF